MGSLISLVGFLGAALVVAFCRQPNVKFFSPVTVFNRKQKLNAAGANLYVAFLAVAIVGIGLKMFVGVSSSTESALPSCEAQDTQKLLKEAFDGSQLARTENLSLVEATRITHTKDEGKTKRMCSAQISLNNAQNASIRYELESRPDGKVMLTFEVGEEDSPRQATSANVPSPQAAQETAVANPTAPAEQAQQAPTASDQPLPVQEAQQAPRPAGLAAGGAVPDIVASFDCAKASSKVEKLICSDGNTANADSELADTYRAALSRSNDKPALKQAQRDWIAQVRNACGDTDCLTRVTEARVQALTAMK